MSSRILRRTSKVAASSRDTSCGAVVAEPAGIAPSKGMVRIFAISTHLVRMPQHIRKCAEYRTSVKRSDAKIGLTDMRLLQKVGGQALRHDPPLLQHVGAVGDLERL